MIAALRSEFGPLPDQSMHEKTSVPALIEELYTFLRQADARELGGLFRELDTALGAVGSRLPDRQGALFSLSVAYLLCHRLRGLTIGQGCAEAGAACHGSLCSESIPIA